MQLQNIIQRDNTNKISRTSRLSAISIGIIIILSCLILLSSCVLWVRTPNDRDHDNGHRGHSDNGKHRGERHTP
jgi:hypothetical protein